MILEAVQTMPTPEDKARENIDRLLSQAGCAECQQSDANILAYRRVAVRNFALEQGQCFAILTVRDDEEPVEERQVVYVNGCSDLI